MVWVNLNCTVNLSVILNPAMFCYLLEPDLCNWLAPYFEITSLWESSVSVKWRDQLEYVNHHACPKKILALFPNPMRYWRNLKHFLLLYTDVSSRLIHCPLNLVEPLKGFWSLVQWRLRETSSDFDGGTSQIALNNTIGIQPRCVMSPSCGLALWWDYIAVQTGLHQQHSF